MDGDDRISAPRRSESVHPVPPLHHRGRALLGSRPLLPGLHADEVFFYDLNLLFPDLNIEDELNPRWIGTVELLLPSLRGPIRYFNFFPATKSYHALYLNRFLHLIFQKRGREKLSICRSYRNSIPAPRLQLPPLLPLAQRSRSLLGSPLASKGLISSQHDINALINQSKKLTRFEGHYLYPTDGEESL